MTQPIQHQPDPSLDLILERTVDVPKELIWKAWTTPELLMQWFCPLPWKTTECEMDLRPGGKFRTVMRGPGGEESDNTGCILEVVENQKLVWTGALGPGYRPRPASVIQTPGVFLFTAVISMEDSGAGSKYSALVIHGDEEARIQHDAMGFQNGWGTAYDQMIEMIKR